MKNGLLIAAGLILIAVSGVLFYTRSDPKPAPPAPVAPPTIPPPPPRPVNHPWNGFGVGSWIIMERAVTKDGVTTTTREKHTLIEILPTGPILNVRKAAGDTYAEPGERVDPPLAGELVERQVRWKPQEPRADKLEIGGVPRECVVTEYLYENPQREIINRAIAWRSTELKVPYRQLQRNGPDTALPTDLLRLELTLKAGKQHQLYDVRVTNLATAQKVGARDVPCVLEEGTVDEFRRNIPVKGTFRKWTSDAVPGRVVRFETSGTNSGAYVARTEVLLDFEAKP